jgi:hypothetical protein
MMIAQRLDRSFPLIVMLCLCVIMQMLGSPGTLLNPTLSTDVFAPTLEGFSIPPSLTHVMPFAHTIAVTETPKSFHVPVLAFTLFHPPLR